MSVDSATNGRKLSRPANPSRKLAQPSYSLPPPHLRKEKHRVCDFEFSLFAREIVTEGEDALPALR
jgi:hypothetical protein